VLPSGNSVFLVNDDEWVLANSIIRRLRRAGDSALDLIGPLGNPWRFRWLPAVGVFLAFNGLMAVFLTVLRAFLGFEMHDGLALWQGLLLVIVVPVTAGFCEELIWRGCVITQLEARGRGRWATILLAAVSFAFIHSPIHWPFTFLLGILTGCYYSRERNLVPLRISHVVADVWSFGWYLFVRWRTRPVGSRSDDGTKMQHGERKSWTGLP